MLRVVWVVTMDLDRESCELISILCIRYLLMRIFRGIQHYERGLMWAETYQSGHMEPQFQPRVSYRHLQWVLGRIDVL